jgi:hypothetical protein
MDMIDEAEDGDVVDGTWNKPPKDPILILLCHSDCSGSIAPDDAALLADRLEGCCQTCMAAMKAITTTTSRP